jgi:hypothetical protein
VIFFAYANEREERGRYLRHLPNELKRTRHALASAKREVLCELVERPNVTAEEIFEVLQDPAYRGCIAVFHFGGHANSYELLLETAERGSQPIFASGLASFLGQQRSLQLVFLNACSTQPQVEELLNANVPAVIATSRTIDDEVATDFAGHFYTELAGGATIEAAYHRAEAAVKTVKGTSPRALYWDEQTADDRWPWGLYPMPAPETR